MILVAVGANLPDAAGRAPAETCRWAVAEVAARAGLELVACSRWFGSAPVPRSDQPDYVNGVARFRGSVDPHRLLRLLHGVEAEAGRVRTVANAARPLDLDLLAVDGLVVDDAALRLPHPRWHARGFVLLPLCDVAPELVGPGGATAAALLERADLAGVSVLGGG